MHPDIPPATREIAAEMTKILEYYPGATDAYLLAQVSHKFNLFPSHTMLHYVLTKLFQARDMARAPKI